MAITKRNPRTIHLAGPITKFDDRDYVASATITPGHLVEFHDDGSNLDVRPHDTGTEVVSLAVALEREEMNKTIADDYAAGDQVKIGFLAPGSIFYGLIPSGQNISRGEFLQSNGDGTLVTASATTQDAALAKFQSIDNHGLLSALTRGRILVVQ